jgi:hypothetical protein
VSVFRQEIIKVMKIKISYIYKFALPMVVTLFTLSCKNTFDITPDDVLEENQVFNTVSDADAAVYGTYGKFIKLADRYVILNELRGDLMDVTFKSNQYLKELSTHSVSKVNPYANPKPFYEVIANCNDVLKNLDRMRAEGKISQLDRDERYSDIGCLRSWVYLQLGIHFGEIPYVTEPIANINDLNNQSLFPRLNLDQLIVKLVEFTGSLPILNQYQQGITTVTLPNVSSGLAEVIADGVPLSRIFALRRLILGDLYLWNNQYVEAATQFKEIMNLPFDEFPPLVQNRVQWTIGNIDGHYQGFNWRNMFTAAFGTGTNPTPGFNQEWIWTIPFNKTYTPSPFPNLFSYTSGTYQLKPSDLAIKNWRDQTRADNSPFDLRGFGASYTFQSGYPVVRKWIAQYNVPLEKTGIFYLSRAADLHFRIAEAANRDGKNRLSYSLLSYSLKHLFDPHQGPQLYSENTGRNTFNSDWPEGSARRDLRNLQRTPYAYPFNYSGNFYNFPQQVRGQFSSHVSIRGRVGLPILRIDSARFFDMSGGKNWRFVADDVQLKERPVFNAKGLAEDMEDKILNEAALESAFEGHRWQMLVRLARRRQDPSVLAKRVAQKFRVAGDVATADAVEAKLMDPKNWFLPFNLE